MSDKLGFSFGEDDGLIPISTLVPNCVDFYGGFVSDVEGSLSSVDRGSAAIKTDGTLWLWGNNLYGQLGDNTLVNKSSPVQTISGSSNWKYVDTGVLHTAAIKTDGTLWMWGYGFFGRLGDNTTISRSSPVQTISGGTNWKQVSCGGSQTAAIKTDGTLWLWGNSSAGQLGDNTIIFRSSPVQTISGGTNWKQVSCGGSHTAAIKTDGSLWLWGNGTGGKLGDDTIINKSSPVQTISGGNNWKQVSCGNDHTAAIKTDGTLWLWGNNFYGRLGDNADIHRSSPVQTISGGTNWKQVGCGYYHTAAIKTDGTLWLWGAGSSGKLGDNTTIHRSSPVQIISGGTNWKQVSCGQNYTMAIRTDGSRENTLWTWGNNESGQLGYSSFTEGKIPRDFSDSFILKDKFTEGGLVGWGSGQYGKLGDDTNIDKSSPVQTISGGTNWKQVSGNYYHTTAIKTDGTLWSWGIGLYGNLGDNTIINRSSPIQTISGGTNWKQVSGGYYYTAAIKTDGTLWSWGYNANGQLGDGTTIHRSSPVQTISGGTNWKQVSGGAYNMAAIKTDGTLWMWGSNINGTIGDNTSIAKSSPVQTISGGNNWKQVSCGQNHTAAIKTDGTLWLWGEGNYGNLGDNTIIDRSSPIQTISGGTNWKQVSGGYYYTAAIKTDGTLWSWGLGTSGQLGDNTLVDKSSPVQTISGGNNWKQVACGLYHTAAIKTDGTLWLWGNNLNGRLGDNTSIYKSSPVQTISGGNNWKQVSGGGSYTFAIKEDEWW